MIDISRIISYFESCFIRSIVINMPIVCESYFSERLNPEEHENLEDITIVWFDRSVKQSDDCIDFQSRICHIINYLVDFNDCTECKDYLLSIKQEKVF